MKNAAENENLPNHAAKRSSLSVNDTEGSGHKINSTVLKLILNFFCESSLVYLFFKISSKGQLTWDKMAWQDDSVPDGIGDDLPLNGVAGSQHGGPRVIIDKWGMQSTFSLHSSW